MGSLVSIVRRKKIFALNEAQSLLPIIIKMTESAQAEVRKLTNRFNALGHGDSSHATLIEYKINEIIERWHDKIEKLGAEPKGMWLVDFDEGSGYFCWKYPENSIAFYHGYNDGFSARRPIYTNYLEMVMETKK